MSFLLKSFLDIKGVFFLLILFQLPYGNIISGNTNPIDTASIRTLEQIVKELSYSNPDSAIILSGKLFHAADSLDLARIQISALRMKAIAQQRIGAYEKGITNLEQATEIAVREDLKIDEADCLVSTGLLYRSNNNIEKALEYLLRAKLIFQEHGDEEDIAFLDSNMGIIYASIEAYPKAIRYFDNAIQNGGFRTKSTSLINKGFAYLHQATQDSLLKERYLDSAILTQKFALSLLADSTMFNYLKPTALFTISASYLSKKEYTKGLPYVDSLNIIAKTINSPYYKTMGDVLFAQLYSGLGNDSLAEYYILECEQGMKNVFDNSHLLWLYDKLSENYLDQDDHKKAKYYMSSFKALSDSLTNSHNSNSVKQADKLQSLLEVENRVTELENVVSTKTRLIRWLVAVSLISLGFMLFLFLRSEKRKKQEQEKAERFRKMVETGEFLLSPTPIPYDIQKDEISEDKTNRIKDDLVQNVLTGLEILISKNRHIKKDFTLTKAAYLLGTNRTYLSKIINSELDQSFSDFLNQARIKTALQWIESDEKFKFYSSEAMAKSLGYKSRSTFRLAFTKVTGVTPAAYISTIKQVD